MSGTIARWGTDWDTVKLGGVVIPGRVHVSVKTPPCVDKRKGHGRKRSKPRDQGQGGAKVSLSIRLGAGDLADFASKMVPLLKPQGKTKAQGPLEIVSTECALWGISLVMVDTIESDQPSSGGPKVIEVELVEYDSSPAAITKPKEKPKSEADGWKLPPGYGLPPSQAPKTGRPDNPYLTAPSSSFTTGAGGLPPSSSFTPVL